MDSGRWRVVERVLDLTLDSDRTRWAAVLDEHCSGDPALRQEVEALLARYESATRFLDSPPAAAAAALIKEAQGATYTREIKKVGAYRLVREIGRGGMSLVFLAERDDGHFTQQVALKLLRPGHDSEIDQGRFRAERQILASLNHPNIARLLDGGVIDDGLPYLVMELVDGEPIDRHCEMSSLSLNQRLEMFLTVAEATQYAHRSLVVHRDLKPSNILVTRDGQVKLLDFGLAKLLEPSGPESTATLTTQRWMTPEYAAPEQVLRQPVTTLTDVYQLGVVLYQLVTGKLPFGTREQSAYQLERAILEREPDSPSAIALQSALRGDLDAIVLKALRKEPEQRYASAQEFADDIRRHISGHPVLARRQTAIYRARRFARRNAWALAAAATLIVAASGYAITVTVQRARVEQALARATAEAQKAEGSTQFLVGLFSNAMVPGPGPRDVVTAEELLSRGERQVSELRDRPLAHAQLLSVLGTIHHRMRSYARAETLLTRALALRREILGEENADVAESMYQLGMVFASRGESPKARPLFQRALDIQRRLLGEAHPAVAETQLRLSGESGSTIDERIVLSRQALAAARRAKGPEHPDVAEQMLRLGIALRSNGLYVEAEPVLREALAMRRRVAASDQQNIYRHMAHLGILLMNSGKLAESEKVHREIVAMHEARFGADRMGVSDALRMLSDVLMQKGAYDEAEQLARRDLAIREREFGTHHLDYAHGLYPLADVVHARGNLAEAESLRRRELAILQTAYGAEHEHIAGSLHGLAMVLLDQGKDAEADSLLLKSLSLRERRFGKESQEAAQLFPALAKLARVRRDYPRADSLLTVALAILKAYGWNDNQYNVQEVYREQVALYDAWGKPEKAAAPRALLIVRKE
jgi:tetratricopeptide (TPR) repeat protein